MNRLVNTQAVLRELEKSDLQDLQLKSILEQLLILKGEVEEAIKAIKEAMEKNSSSKIITLVDV
jgi:hypothetical protein